MAEVKIQDGESIESALRRFKRRVQQEDIIKELRENLERLGLDPEQAEALVLARTSERVTSKAAQPYQKLPIREWETRRKGLSEEVNRTSNLLLNRLDIGRGGRELINAGIPATNNFVACVTLINKEIKKQNPKPRNEWSTEEFEASIRSLEDVLNTLTRRYKGILNGKAKG